MQILTIDILDKFLALEELSEGVPQITTIETEGLVRLLHRLAQVRVREGLVARKVDVSDLRFVLLIDRDAELDIPLTR